MRLSIIIPCYNEEKVIDETISVLLNVAKELKTKDIVDYEMIFVDDGSADNTFHVLEKHSNIHREIKIIKTISAGAINIKALIFKFCVLIFFLLVSSLSKKKFEK